MSTRCVSLKYSRTRDGLALPFLLSFRLSAFSSPEPFLFLFHFYDVSKLAFPANHYDAYRVLQDAWRSRFNFHCKTVPTTAYTASFSLTHYFQHRNPTFVYHEIDCFRSLFRQRCCCSNCQRCVDGDDIGNGFQQQPASNRDKRRLWLWCSFDTNCKPLFPFKFLRLSALLILAEWRV